MSKLKRKEGDRAGVGKPWIWVFFERVECVEGVGSEAWEKGGTIGQETEREK